MAKKVLKRVLFIAGDVGGARALLPVIEECEKQGVPFKVISHGCLMQESPPQWPVVDLPEELTDKKTEKFLKELDLGALAFGSSVHDLVPLTVARGARSQNIPVVHVLDNWSGYRRRLEHDGLPMLLPDIYTVMDEAAYTGAAADGIDPSVLKITGHPGLASLGRELAISGGNASPHRLLFVSEPVTADQGKDATSPGFRGYTEDQALTLFCQALQSHAGKVNLFLLPHPRQDRDRLCQVWEEVRGKVQGIVLEAGEGRRQVLQADAVAGMASLLLYEAWLTGKPVLSLQPGLRLDSLRMLAGREGVIFVDSPDPVSQSVSAWIAEIRRSAFQSRPDLRLHSQAPEMVFRLLIKELEKHNQYSAVQEIGQ